MEQKHEYSQRTVGGLLIISYMYIYIYSRTDFIRVYCVLSKHESILAAAPLWNIGKHTPVHEDIPGEGVRSGDDGRQYPQTKECQVKDTLVPECQ